MRPVWIITKGYLTSTYVEPGVGIEPTTCALQVRCSTTELPRPTKIVALTVVIIAELLHLE